MHKKEVEKILDEKVDWVEVHKCFCFPLWGFRTQIIIWNDGHVSEMQSNETFQDSSVYDRVIGIIDAEGITNLDSKIYLDGWTKYVGNDRYKDLDTGNILTFNAAVIRAIEDGEWNDCIVEWKKAISEKEIWKK